MAARRHTPSLPGTTSQISVIGPGKCSCNFECIVLTHWGRVTHTCVGKLSIIGSDNGLSPGRRQAIIWTIAGILLIGPWGTNFSEIFISIHTFSFKKIQLKMSSGKWRPFCLGLNVLNGSLTNGCQTTYPLRHTTRHFWGPDSVANGVFLAKIPQPRVYFSSEVHSQGYIFGENNQKLAFCG